MSYFEKLTMVNGGINVQITMHDYYIETIAECNKNGNSRSRLFTRKNELFNELCEMQDYKRKLINQHDQSIKRLHDLMWWRDMYKAQHEDSIKHNYNYLKSSKLNYNKLKLANRIIDLENRIYG